MRKIIKLNFWLGLGMISSRGIFQQKAKVYVLTFNCKEQIELLRQTDPDQDLPECVWSRTTQFVIYQWLVT